MTKSTVVVTVDVEDFFLPRPPVDTVLAQWGGVGYGVPRIMDILEDHGARGTFFVDVYNRVTLDEGLLREACQEIDRRGHEVGLHTHPAFPSGRRGYGMEQVLSRYDLAWQTDFIRQGRDMITSWIGRPPRSHRAGGYGANLDTLRALAACQITIDSSLLTGYALCGLNGLLSSSNTPSRLESMLEIPISVTRTSYKARVMGRQWALLAMTKKVDPDWAGLFELKRQILALRNSGLTPLVIMLHSYALLDVGRSFRPVLEAEKKFRALISWLSAQKDLVLSPLGQYVDRMESCPDRIIKDSIPEVEIFVDQFDRQTIRWLAGRVQWSHAALLLDWLKGQKR
jgi:peptidoglycan/xylan/chitin deacetylase (PgdA/CDA1 family)